MSDTLLNDNNNDSSINVDWFWFFVILIWFCYCCRSNSQNEDPADDALAGWNASNISSNAPDPTLSLEERRQYIEDRLIIRKVLQAESSVRSAHGDGDDNNDEDDASSFREWFATRLTKSERTFSSYSSAIATRRSPKLKRTQFSEPLFRRAVSLPVEATTTTISTMSGQKKEQEDKNNDPNTDGDPEITISPTTKPVVSEERIQEMEEEDEDVDVDMEQPSILHRRKADIVARKLASTLRVSSQDYDQPTTCDICLMDYEKGEQVAWSKNDECVHAFHKECIVDWLLRNPKCPLCRNDYLHDSHPDHHDHDHDHPHPGNDENV